MTHTTSEAKNGTEVMRVKRTGNGWKRTLAAIFAASVFCAAALPIFAVSRLPQEDPDRFKYISATAEEFSFSVEYAGHVRSFAVGAHETAIRGIPDTTAVNVRRYLRLIAVDQGFGKAVAIGCVLPETLAEIEKWLASFDVPASDSRAVPTENGWRALPARDGSAADRKALYDALYDAARSGGGTVRVPSVRVAPAVTESDIEEETRLRARFATDISSSTESRKHNVRLALSAFDGLVVPAGGRVSFNEIVGARTAARGYRTAKIILGGKYVDGVGGGVCQAATTLYNAVLRAGLDVEEVYSHSLAPSYVPPSADAMVNSGGADFVFSNRTLRNVYIRTHVSSVRAQVAVYGLALRAPIEVYSEIVSRTPEPAPILARDDGTYADRVTYDDERITVRRGRGGLKSKLYVKEKGMPMRHVRTNIYAPVQGKIVYGRVPAALRPVPYGEGEKSEIVNEGTAL